jgi:pyruvate kinase
MNKKTKIVCTIGPASSEPAILKKMIKAGMNVARLNFSHGNYEDFKKIIANIKKVSRDLKTPVAILQDLQGPKIRLGKLKENTILKNGRTIILTTKNNPDKADTYPVQYKKLPNDVKKNDKILIADGMIELKVLKRTKTEITCKVLAGGFISSHKGINVPTASISQNPLTLKDKQDLNFGIEHDVDFVALSFVRSAKDIAELRNLIRKKHGRAKIIAKIERHEAIKNIEEIIHETDGIMVARGDMGVEISPEKVPLYQKKIIHLANIHGKPVITATEMMQSMITNPRPTRAEVSDIANAVFDHTDALMLSNESAVGKFPVKAVDYMAKVARSTENELKKHKKFLPNKLFEGNFPLSYATCSNGAQLASNIGADLIVVITRSGFTAQHVAKHRIYIPIIVVTEDHKVQNQMQLVWGTQKTLIKDLSEIIHPAAIRKLLLEKKIAQKGQKVVIVSNATTNEKSIFTIII